ncbi:MAG: S-layer homology domain-containing protein [Clostridia bacterium]|nr:S-layer homology domain-containing protein [Clostridia bacterium]
MKLSKKILSVLCLVLTLCMLSSQITFAANVKTSQEAADALNKLGLFQGTGNGYELEKSLTRAEAVTMIVRLLGEEETAMQTKLEHPFTDVPEWASPYVGYAFAHNITKGVSETQFDSNSKVTLQQFLTFVLRILEYKDGNVDFVWNAPEELAMEVGLIFSINLGEFLRGDMVKICLNALNASYKNTSLPMYKMLVERNVFTASQYKTALGLNKNNGFSSGGSNSGGGNNTPSTPSNPTTPNTPVEPEESITPDTPIVPDEPTTPPSDSEPQEGSYKLVLEEIKEINSKEDNCFKMNAILSEDGKQIMISLSLDGKVNLSGFDMALQYNPKHFKLNNLDDALDLQVYSAHNEDLGIITFNYVGIKNITESKEILTATFDFIGKEKIDSKFLLQAIEMIKIDEKDVNDILNVDYNLTEINYSIK